MFVLRIGVWPPLPAKGLLCASRVRYCLEVNDAYYDYMTFSLLPLGTLKPLGGKKAS